MENNISTKEAAMVLRMFEGLIATAFMGKDSDKMNEEMKMMINKFHSSVDLACDALSLMGNNTIEIDGGDK